MKRSGAWWCVEKANRVGLRPTKLLSKFNIKEDEKTIGKILEKKSEEVELEEFEEKLG